MIRIIFLYVFMMSLCACSEQRSSNREGEFRLFDGESTQLFLMPKGLKVEQNMQSLLFFRVQYPTMSARDPQGVPQGDEISVLISLADHPGSTEFLVQQAAEKIDLSRPGQVYRDGKEGEFEIFRGDLDKLSLLPQDVTYVFRDDDGELVGIEDPGSWSHAYSVRRKIGSKIHVRYLIAKPLGRDFKRIDKTVKDFILKHAKDGIQ